MAMSLLDSGQIIKEVFDATHDALQVNVVASTGASSIVEITSGDESGNKVLVTVDNAIKTDGSATTQPISGTITANQGTPGVGAWPVVAVQAGTWDIRNVTGTVSLPTGASTVAKQPALGTAGTASSDVITVQGIASMTPIKINTSTPTAGTITQAAIAVGTSAVRLTVSGSAPASTRILLAAIPDSASTAIFYIGSSGVTSSGATRGFQLLGGQSFIANNDAADYYIISDTAGQTVFITQQG